MCFECSTSSTPQTAAIWREDEADLCAADPGHIAAVAADGAVHAGAHRGHAAHGGCRAAAQEVKCSADYGEI